MPFAPNVKAPIPVPDCEARFNEDETAHREPCEVVGLQRVRDPSVLKKGNGIDEELRLEEEEEEDNQIRDDNQFADDVPQRYEVHIIGFDYQVQGVFPFISQ
ncbi:MAG: hypothetical protein EZS28_038396 [Streblomastix strix]|uniref:Uncharacterized protein n=1 Tax=Streblomastix strix TaxID=222440 RepID=A0A5J4U5G5_9EUKA|nr:MAG: hypothetical protein EZS28_038396 [Streblomastix strix]